MHGDEKKVVFYDFIDKMKKRVLILTHNTVCIMNYLRMGCGNSMKTVEKLVKAINGCMFNVSCVLVLALIGIICMDVVARYIFNSPIAWVYEMPC